MKEWFMFMFTIVAEVACAVYFYDSFLVQKWSRPGKILSCIILYIVGIGNAMLIEMLPPVFYPLKLLTWILIHILYVKISYHVNLITGGYLACLGISLLILMEMVFQELFKLNYNENHAFVSAMGLVSCMMLFVITYFLRKKLTFLKQYLRDNSDTLRWFIWLPFITVIPGLYFAVFFISSTETGYFGTFVSAALIVINIVALFILQESLIKDEKLRLSAIQAESKQNQLQAFRDMQSLYERQGRKLHDYKKQIATVQELLKNGDVEKAIGFTEQLTKSIAVEMSEVNVGHPVINAVLNQQYRVAKGKNIGMTLAVSDLNDIGLADDDIVILLGNLIENAIHECEKVIAHGREASIRVKFIKKDANIVLTVRNPVVEKVMIIDNRVQGDFAEGHGIGLSNVESVAEKYEGNLVISCDDNEFTAVVII